MAVRGKQDFWVVGSRVLFRRSDATTDEMVDLGIIKSLTPNFATDKITLDDTDGGQKSVAYEVVSKFTESYDFTCANFSPANLSLIFSGKAPSTWSQAVTYPAGVAHTVAAKGLHKAKDASGVFVYNLTALIVTKPGDTITACTPGSKTFKVATDKTTTYTTGKKVRVSGNAGGAAANVTLTVVSSSFASSETTITVSETVDAGTTVSGKIAVEYTVTTDYVVTDLARGLFEVVSGGGISAGSVDVVYVTAATASGDRLIYPQTAGGTVTGKAVIVFGRGGNAEQSFRECDVSLSTNGLNLTADDVSDFTLTATVLTDRSRATDPAGRLVSAIGAIP